MLKPDEEHELALRVRDHNDPDAAFRLVSSHLRLVVRIAMVFSVVGCRMCWIWCKRAMWV